MSTLVVRPRRPDDIGPLSEALMEQQPATRYPFRNPLPFPVPQFLHADDALAAYTAELAGRPVGHACRIGPAQGFPGADEMNAACAAAYGCGVEELTWLSAVFVGTAARGTGAGRRLHDAIVADAHAADRRPCLEVLSIATAARGLYLAAGWREVMRTRPAWLAEADQSGELDVSVMVLDAPDLSAPS